MMGDFWNDCIKNQASTSQKLNTYSEIYKKVGENNLSKKRKENSKPSLNLYLNHDSSNKKENNTSKNKSMINQTTRNSNLVKIFKNHPLIKEKSLISKEEKINKIKKKISLFRCLGLYAYGMEVKKEKLLTDQNIQKEKINEEILKCTFKPKINKYSSLKLAKYLTDANNKKTINNEHKNNTNNVYRLTTLSSYENGISLKNEKAEKSKENNNINNKAIKAKKNTQKGEYTFKPKLYKRNIKTIFDKSKSIEKDKTNEKFIMRYNKARECYMKKKIKQLSNKDDSYSTMLTEFNCFTNKHKKIKKINFCMKYINTETNTNNNINSKKAINIEQNVIHSLRNQLLDINLNEEEK